MKIRTVKVIQAFAVAWCMLAGGAAYLGCSSDDSVALPVFDGGQDGATTLTDAGDAGDGATPYVDGGPCPDPGGDAPNDLRCTGLYSDFAAKTVDSNNKAYTPGVVLWSDGAQKSRWLYLPPGTKIDTSDMDQWSFPVGTKVWKEFAFSGQKIETRFYEKIDVATIDGGPGQWAWASYQWSADQTTAIRADNGANDAGPNNYSIPAHGDCGSCHIGGIRDRLLGVEALALGLASSSGQNLAALQSAGLLTVNPPSTTLTIPDDGLQSPAALGYLHMNCGVSCHNQNPNALCTGSGLWMRLSATAAFADAGAGSVALTDTYMTAVNHPPTIFPLLFADAGWNRITPGDALHSEIPAVDSVRGGPDQMPPLATHVVDEAGVAAVSNWINALP
jgi:mono/diheme cytochrome c family protein